MYRCCWLVGEATVDAVARLPTAIVGFLFVSRAAFCSLFFLFICYMEGGPQSQGVNHDWLFNNHNSNSNSIPLTSDWFVHKFCHTYGQFCGISLCFVY